MSFNLDGTVQKELITDIFIPNTRKALVGQAMVTTKEVMDADSVKVWGVGDVTVGDYTGGTITPNAHADTSVVLTLDNAKYFAERVEKIDDEEAALNILPRIIENGSYSIADAIDSSIFAELATSTNDAGAYTLDSTNILGFIRDMSVALSNANAPKIGRKLAITPEASAYLAEALGDSGSNEIATEAGRMGYVRTFAGFDIYETNNLADATTGKWAIASVDRGVALGLGYNDLDVEDIPGQFYSVAKGLTAYGVKLVKDSYVFKADIA